MTANPSVPELQLIALHHFGRDHGYRLSIDRLPAGSPFAWRLQFQRADDPVGAAGAGYFGKAVDTAAEIPAAVRELWGVVTRWDSYRASTGRQPLPARRIRALGLCPWCHKPSGQPDVSRSCKASSHPHPTHHRQSARGGTDA